MRLALPVQNPKSPGTTLLKAGYELTDKTIQRLVDMDIRSIWVRYPPLDYLEEYVNSETVQARADVVHQITDTFTALQSESTARLPYDTYTKSMMSLVESLMTHPQSAVFMDDLAQGDDDLVRHSSAVMYLTVIMGLKLESYIVKQRKHVDPNRAKQVTNLGLGAMLHDIGMSMLPAPVRAQWEESHDESLPAYREHTTLGFRAVRGKIEPTAANVVLHHHQRFDGSGYTGRDFPILAGESIHIFSRIASLADAFDRMHRPPNLPAQPTVWVLSSLLTPAIRQQFDPFVIAALFEVVPPYPPGSIVRLSNGSWAAVIEPAPADPCRPTVQPIPKPDGLTNVDEAKPIGEPIKLSEQPTALHIVECDGVAVGELNFDGKDVPQLGRVATWV